ncbi:MULTISPECIES: phosphopantetheine-binding protein [unclassified Streptomyces]|uniref:phosphopantetheine-binding protein n=1 Tax=unclassified Streptomyces TaxID=2593676 RepID=UPI000DAEA0C2|nr:MULTISPECIES: phosphopantetheine-binding protein [unclassified Streptomyces]PZT71685.1 acyl carrier protein [Streptomyces sp. AC1-42T]PZT73188.1 acyl carrier protein [Streptomyces sp. AC1-42W]
MSNTATIKQFLIEEFLPDLTQDQLADDQDLLSSGAIDSLGLLKLIAWVEDRFGLAVDDTDLDPNNFRSVTAIGTFVANARQGVSG